MVLAPQGDGHDCEFQEVVIEPGDYPDDDPLQPGMHVLKPCPCGETPLVHMNLLHDYFMEAQEALQTALPHQPLYHWAPRERRKSIEHYGLKPFSKPTVTIGENWGHRAPVICLGDSPSWAWQLSGGMSYAPRGEYDLWETALHVITEPVVLPSLQTRSGWHEVRTEHRIYKRHLTWIASRRNDE